MVGVPLACHNGMRFGRTEQTMRYQKDLQTLGIGHIARSRIHPRIVSQAENAGSIPVARSTCGSPLHARLTPSIRADDPHRNRPACTTRAPIRRDRCAHDVGTRSRAVGRRAQAALRALPGALPDRLQALPAGCSLDTPSRVNTLEGSPEGLAEVTGGPRFRFGIRLRGATSTLRGRHQSDREEGRLNHRPGRSLHHARSAQAHPRP